MPQRITNERLLEEIVKTQKFILNNRKEIKKIGYKIDEIQQFINSALDVTNDHEERITALEKEH